MNRRIRKKQLKPVGDSVMARETKNLDITIAKFILPRLELFREENDCYPPDLDSSEEWDAILGKMIIAFRFVAEKYGITVPDEKERNAVIQEGLDLFRKYYCQLWW